MLRTNIDDKHGFEKAKLISGTAWCVRLKKLKNIDLFLKFDFFWAKNLVQPHSRDKSKTIMYKRRRNREPWIEYHLFLSSI